MHAYRKMYSRNIERLEQFWHNLVLALPQAKDMNGAVVTCYPEVPFFFFNHVADINVNEDEAEKLLNKVTKYFVSKGSPYIWFRVSPLTRPKSFTSLLEDNGFERDDERSVMVFKGRQMEDKLNPEIKVKEISESEIDVYSKLLLTIFEMPLEWKKGFDRVFLESMRKGLKCYLAYVEGKPVGTCAWFSLMKTGGIFDVGTLKEYRRRGIGTTLTVHAVMDSIKEGNNLHHLQTAKGGNAERLYKKIGFKIDHTTSRFVKKLKDKD